MCVFSLSARPPPTRPSLTQPFISKIYFWKFLSQVGASQSCRVWLHRPCNLLAGISVPAASSSGLVLNIHRLSVDCPTCFREQTCLSFFSKSMSLGRKGLLKEPPSGAKPRPCPTGFKVNPYMEERHWAFGLALPTSSVSLRKHF